MNLDVSSDSKHQVADTKMSKAVVSSLASCYIW